MSKVPVEAQSEKTLGLSAVPAWKPVRCVTLSNTLWLAHQ